MSDLLNVTANLGLAFRPALLTKRTYLRRVSSGISSDPTFSSIVSNPTCLQSYYKKKRRYHRGDIQISSAIILRDSIVVCCSTTYLNIFFESWWTITNQMFSPVTCTYIYIMLVCPFNNFFDKGFWHQAVGTPRELQSVDKLPHRLKNVLKSIITVRRTSRTASPPTVTHQSCSTNQGHQYVKAKQQTMSFNNK